MSLIYLAGPITGLSYGEVVDWREYVIKKLSVIKITGLSPMRHKEYLSQEKSISSSYENSVLSCAKGITTRDKWDCHRCDALFVNLIGAEKVSIGTMLELGWASSVGKPIILCIEDKGNIHDHCMVREIAGFVVNSVDHGLEIARALFAGTN